MMVVMINMGMIVVMVMVVRAVVMLMPVVPQLGLVEQEKEHHPHQQGHEQAVRADVGLKRLRQQVHEGRGQQSTGGQTQQMLGVARQQGIGQHGRQQHTAQARCQRAHPNRNQGHVAIIPESVARAQARPCRRNQSSMRCQPSLASRSR